jgi:hypothetical protein
VKQPSSLITLLLSACLNIVVVAQVQTPQPPPPVARGAQPAWVPPDPTNLQVLPKTIAKRDLVLMMRGFTRALGVRCPHCHVGNDGDDLSTFDFASDEKAPKRSARVMIRMLADLNRTLASVGDKPAGEPRVSCYTCHRGDTQPLLDRPQGG